MNRGGVYKGPGGVELSGDGKEIPMPPYRMHAPRPPIDASGRCTECRCVVHKPGAFEHDHVEDCPLCGRKREMP